jgi:hypothetical protein
LGPGVQELQEFRSSGVTNVPVLVLVLVLVLVIDL